MALTPEELKQAKQEILQELITSMHKMMADKFAPEAPMGPGLELSAEQGSLETPEGKMEFGPEVSMKELPEEGTEPEAEEETSEEEALETPEHESAESPEEEKEEHEEMAEEEEGPSPLDSFLSKIPPHKMPKEEDEEEGE